MSTSNIGLVNPAEPRRGPNMADVAKLAGVSPMTVSRVMNGKSTVRASTRKKVTAAAAALNYAPNPEARLLAGSRPIRIGFLYSMPSVRSGAYLTEVLLGLLNKVSLNNVQLLVEKCADGEQIALHTQRLIDNQMDGIILPPPLVDNAEIVARIVDAGIPLVLIACGQPDARAGAIGIDDRQAAYEMTRHLIELGHQRIGFISGHPYQSASSARLEGYQAAIKEFGADPAAELVTQGMFNYRSGLDASEILLALHDRPTAIFASNDDMAAATVAVAHRLGARRAGRYHGGRLRRYRAVDHDLAGAHHRAPADHGHGRGGDRMHCPARDERAHRLAGRARAHQDRVHAGAAPVRRGAAHPAAGAHLRLKVSFYVRFDCAIIGVTDLVVLPPAGHANTGDHLEYFTSRPPGHRRPRRLRPGRLHTATFCQR